MLLKGEQDGQMTTNDADDGWSQGIVDDPDDDVHDPGGCAEQQITHTNDLATAETSETTTSRAIEANSPRPSRDPADAMDDDTHHPDESAEPPDQPEGARVRGG